MKDDDQEIPYAADTFRSIPVVQIDGKAMRIPVQMSEGMGPVDGHGRILHIVMTERTFCAWRAR